MHKCVCMCVYICMCMYVSMCQLYVHRHAWISVCVCMYVCVFPDMNKCMYACFLINMYICTQTWINVSMYMYECMQTNKHECLYISISHAWVSIYILCMWLEMLECIHLCLHACELMAINNMTSITGIHIFHIIGIYPWTDMPATLHVFAPQNS